MSNLVTSRTAAFFFVDIVGLSDPSTAANVQQEKIHVLTEAIEHCPSFKTSANPKRIVLPTGDGMAIDFGDRIELPLKLAIELQANLRRYNSGQAEAKQVRVRIGLHNGPVWEFKDIRGTRNVWGQGIVRARRIMDLGDAFHILLSESLANELIGLSDEYKGAILRAGEYPIKHGESIPVYSAYSAARGFGNPEIPKAIGQPTLAFLTSFFAEQSEALILIFVDREIKETELLAKLRNSIRNRLHIDQSFLYWEASAAARWEKICNDPDYSLHRISKELTQSIIEEVIKRLKAETGHVAYDFVNLGTGGGQKDVVILDNLLSAQQERRIRYFPIDQSYSMLTSSINYVLPLLSGSPNRNWDLIAILGDLTRLDRYRGLLSTGPNPKLFGLLGSLIGNFDEVSVLTGIRRFMTPLDVLMIGADLIGDRKPEELTSGYDIPSVKELIIYPIIEHLSDSADLADRFRKATINATPEPGLHVPKSIRVQVHLNVDGTTYDHFYSTKYDYDNLCYFLKRTMNFEFIGEPFTWKDPTTHQPRYAKFLLRKPN